MSLPGRGGGGGTNPPISTGGLPSGFGGAGDFGRKSKGDKGLSLPLAETFKLAWADPDLKARIIFVLAMFAVFTLGTHIPVPIRGYSSEEIYKNLEKIPFFQYLDAFGGGALRRVSILALGLQPYITASIIIQVLTTAFPQWKKELQEGGEYARKTQNKRTRVLALALCFAQGLATLQQMAIAIPNLGWPDKLLVVLFWTAGAMFMLWLGEQISEKGIGNGTSLMIFAGIVLSLPNQFGSLWRYFQEGTVKWYSLVLIAIIFLVATWFIVYFTTAQRRIPIQHMRRQVGTKVMGGATSYLPLSVNMAGVMPIIFASTFLFLPSQFAGFFGGDKSPVGRALEGFGEFMNPMNDQPVAAWLPFVTRGVFGSLVYLVLIFLFTYFWTAIQYNVEDISNNLKRGGSFIPGVRPGKQTKDFLDGVISRITIVGAGFVAVIALLQYIAPKLALMPGGVQLSALGGTSLLIMVSVALETMRQIEANLLMKQYGQ